MTEKITPCDCPFSNGGFCSRHNIKKNPHFHHLCQTNPAYFRMWEECRGPGQSALDCIKHSETRQEILPDVKPSCQSCQQTQSEGYPTQEELKENLPSLWQMTKNLAGSVVNHVVTGMKKTPEEIQKERMNICESCPFLIRDTMRCGKCGCFVQTKTKMESAKCPIGSW